MTDQDLTTETPRAANRSCTGRVLLVDDDPSLLSAIERLLRKRFNVFTANSGNEALKKIDESGPFSVIVSDLQMPGLNGMRFLAQAREKLPFFVPIILSGKADLNVALEALNEGRIFRFLTKPCNNDVLSAAIEAAMERYAANMAERQLFEADDGGSPVVAAFRSIKEMAAKAESSLAEMSSRTAPVEASAKPTPAAQPGAQDDSAEMSTDPATGLPDWTAAQRAIRAMIKADYNAHLAIFCVARYDYTCYRYGAAIGNQILLVCGQHATSDISPGLPVFRWKGPILLALIVSQEAQATVRNAVHSFASVVRHQYFQTPSRTVYLQVRMTFDLVGMRGEDPDKVFAQIEQFAKLHEDTSGQGQGYRPTAL